MKKFLKTSIVAVAASLMAISCDDYVNIDPQYAQDADNYFLSPSDYDKALTGAYDLLQTSYLDMWIGEIASDNSIAGGESVTDSEGLHQIDNMTHGGVNNELRSLFRFMYAGITRVNYIFENKDKLEFDGKTRILAEASFLRAYYYFELVKFFGDVPLIVDKRLSASEISSQTRVPAAEVYAQIEKDLKYAADNLAWTTNVKGRVTKGAALSLLGKAYLYQNKFNESAETLDKVIAEGPYNLSTDYSTLFRVASEGNSETVFDIEYVGIEGGGYGCFVCLEGFVAVGFHSIRGYEGPIYADGNSYNLPTKDLYDEFEPNDPRLPVAILDIEDFKTKALPTVVKYTVGGGGHTGYYNNKYLKRADELGANDNDLTSPVNHRVIRFADVLLMAAEAHNRKPSPNDAQAATYLNRVRQRVSVNMPAVNATGTALTTAIYHERRVELAGEGVHFFDLVRTGRAVDQIAGFKAGKNEVFPIPQSEIDLAGAGWIQNKGY
ncbi:RagB/SusD family nutrient uptake outer membrane protein [Chryseolinea lacunae]|uniref:RagB/SusD family nutrient uptake outer membrane protein n=1 Tax=Chryseolinea lacunae TaxID=2801331 RepID=A0ABS1KZL6_9BACT|nr:RagB/SusD family nutrient uptake outer membrane protein [Chryseolinea lacunae]MBL0744613.1 RagB/SusD family nutrient uptake outer membrane protein [Chryseolinea lacunae]